MMKKLGALVAIGLGLAMAPIAHAGDYDGDFMIRLQGTQLMPQDSLTKLTSVSGAPVSDLKAAGFDAKLNDSFIPTATLSYFFSKNLAVELFCCFGRAHVDLQAPAAFSGLNGRVADATLFPPILTLQYHFDGLGPFKPYVGVGAQYIHYFNASTSRNPLRTTGVSFDDSFGPAVQAGVDFQLGGGWYANLDVKKTWLSTTATWTNSAITGGNVVAKVDVDPLTISGGIGYRFNLFK